MKEKGLMDEGELRRRAYSTSTIRCSRSGGKIGALG